MGNFSTAFRNGTVVQTMNGAYPGSILFGTVLPESRTNVLSPPDMHVTQSKYHYQGVFSLAVCFGIASILFAALKARARKRVVHVYSRVYGVDTQSSATDRVLRSEQYETAKAFDSTRAESSYFELSKLFDTDGASQII